MVKNEYDVSGHILVPYNETTQKILFRKVKKNEYAISKNGVLLDNICKLPKTFIDSFLINREYSVEKKIRVSLTPLKRVWGISIGITRIKKENKTRELLISIHAPDMRGLIKKCDEFTERFEDAAGTKLKSEAKLWTRQEAC